MAVPVTVSVYAEVFNCAEQQGVLRHLVKSGECRPKCVDPRTLRWESHLSGRGVCRVQARKERYLS